MSLVKTGNPLTSKVLQPGSTYTTDGYGLITSRTSYALDKAVLIFNAVKGGDVHPDYTDLFVHSLSFTSGPLNVNIVEANYVGVNTLETTGGRTRPNVTASNGLTSEHITTHPNFFGPVAGYATAIAGDGVTFTASTIDPRYKVGGVNGAHFNGTATNAGNFVGFLDSSTGQKQYFYGKNQYLAPTTSFSGHIYTTNSGDCANLRDRVGKTSTTNQFAGIKLLPDHLGTVFTVSTKAGTLPTIMLSQVNFEDYCVTPGGTPKIFKVNYEIRFNREGYPPEVYASA